MAILLLHISRISESLVISRLIILKLINHYVLRKISSIILKIKDTQQTIIVSRSERKGGLGIETPSEILEKQVKVRVFW